MQYCPSFYWDGIRKIMTNNSQKIQYKSCNWSQVPFANNTQNNVMLCSKFINSPILMSFIETASLTKNISHEIQREDCHRWAGSHGLFHSSFPYSKINLMGCDNTKFDRFQNLGGIPRLHHQNSSTLMMKAAHSFQMLSFQLVHPLITNYYFIRMSS
jgi:hypothetical protein